MLRSTLRQRLELYIGHVPFHRGKWRIVKSILRETKLEEPGRERIHAMERAGLQRRLNPDCAVQRQPTPRGLKPFTQLAPGESYTDIFCVPRD